ncbi:MAG: hypothetical protein E7653_06355 [Ruminococcaceae bacterium]|nr:hypothetical protein [Oscillospiraceae bacterium]
MKNTLRILSLLLAIIMLGAMLVACKGKKKDDDGTTDAPPPVVNNDPYGDELPAELNYGGQTVTILCSAKDTVKAEFYAEGASANAIESAVFKRNETVKSRLGVNLNIILNQESASDISKINTMIRTAAEAGDATYDVAVGATYLTTASVNNGYFRNLHNCTYLNLNKLYWSQGFNSALSYGADRQYIANGSIVLSIYRCLNCTIFNKTMLNNKQEANLYDVVRNKEWTMEYQLNMSRRLATGTANPDTAIYGMAGGLKVSIDPYWVSLNAPLVAKDANNAFQYVGNNKTAKSKVVSASQAIIDLYSDASCFVATYDDDSFTNISTAHETFYNKRAAMSNTVIYNIERTTQQLGDIEYGIVPMPMLNKDQGAYYTGVQDQVSALGILQPVSDDRIQMVGAVLECLASESYKIVVDEYYNNIMQYRFAQDVDTQEMLDIIYEGSCMPLTAIYTGVLNEGIGSGVTTFLRNIVIDGKSAGGQNPASTAITSVNTALKKNVGNLNTAFEGLEAKKAA